MGAQRIEHPLALQRYRELHPVAGYVVRRFSRCQGWQYFLFVRQRSEADHRDGGITEAGGGANRLMGLWIVGIVQALLFPVQPSIEEGLRIENENVLGRFAIFAPFGFGALPTFFQLFPSSYS